MKQKYRVTRNNNRWTHDVPPYYGAGDIVITDLDDLGLDTGDDEVLAESDYVNVQGMSHGYILRDALEPLEPDKKDSYTLEDVLALLGCPKDTALTVVQWAAVVDLTSKINKTVESLNV